MSEFLQIELLVFRFFNLQLASPAMDAGMTFISAEWPWFSLLSGFIAILLWHRDWSQLLRILWMALTVGAGDAVAHHILKPWFGRLRPCRVDALARIIDGCSGWFSFPSNHATNAAAVAGLCFFLISPKLGLLASIFAMLIGISRVYLGVHYPFDVLGGFAFGSILAAISAKCFFLSPYSKWQP